MSDLSPSEGADFHSAPSSIPPIKPASRWEDFVDIFYAPASVFERRATSGFGIPMLVVTVLLGLIFIANSGVMQPIMDAEFTRGTAAAMKKSPQITPEMMAKTREMTEKFTKVGVFIFTPIIIFCVGFILWVVGKLVEAKQTFSAAVMVAAYAFVPKVVESVVAGVQGLLLDPATLNGRYKISLGVGRFLDPDAASPMLLALVGRMDVFTIWVTVLLAIGLSATGNIPRRKAIIAGVLMWIIGALPGVFGALRS